MAKLLTKAEILAASDLKFVEIDVPEWGGTVRVSQVNAADRCTLQALILDKDGKPKSQTHINRIMTVGLCALACVDEDGNKLFTEDDIEAFGKKCAAAVDRVFAAADELNGISVLVASKIKKN